MYTISDSKMVLFHRAVVDRDEIAWFDLYSYCRPYLFMCLPKDVRLSCEPGVLVDRAFARFAYAITPAKLANFSVVLELMEYLKRCVRSVVLDDLRTQKTCRVLREVSLEQLQYKDGSEPLFLCDPYNVFEDIDSDPERQHLWQVMSEIVTKEDERLIVVLLFVLGLQPAELLTRYPQVFSDIHSIYNKRHNLRERLQRNRHLRRVAEEGGLL